MSGYRGMAGQLGTVFESTLGEGDRVSLRETTLQEETGGV